MSKCHDSARLHVKAKRDWPADVALAQVLVWRGLFDEELHLGRHVQRLVVRKVPAYKKQTRYTAQSLAKLHLNKNLWWI